jgi:DNA/RNA-binding domain of Phe-tRNA-synthetase-like protein
MPSLSIADLTQKFPDFRVALVIADGLSIAPHRSPALQAEIADAEARCRVRWAGAELSAIPGVAAWRTAYRAFGIKKTSYRSSVERLLKRVLAGDALPNVNALVDLYNAASLEYGLCLGCDDRDKIDGDLAFRFSREGDTFLDMSAGEGEDPNDPPKEGGVVFADARHVLCRRWNWCQDRALAGHDADEAGRADGANERRRRCRGGGGGRREGHHARIRRDLPDCRCGLREAGAGVLGDRRSCWPSVARLDRIER